MASVGTVLGYFVGDFMLLLGSFLQSPKIKAQTSATQVVISEWCAPPSTAFNEFPPGQGPLLCSSHSSLQSSNYNNQQRTSSSNNKQRWSSLWENVQEGSGGEITTALVRGRPQETQTCNSRPIPQCFWCWYRSFTSSKGLFIICLLALFSFASIFFSKHRHGTCMESFLY